MGTSTQQAQQHRAQQNFSFSLPPVRMSIPVSDSSLSFCCQSKAVCGLLRVPQMSLVLATTFNSCGEERQNHLEGAGWEKTPTPLNETKAFLYLPPRHSINYWSPPLSCSQIQARPAGELSYASDQNSVLSRTNT